MKRTVLVILCLMICGSPAFAQYWKVSLDWSDAPDTFLISAKQGDAGSLRVYNYQAGSALTLPADWGVRAGYGTNWQFSTALQVMDGTIYTNLAYSEITMTSSNLNTNGSFFFQIQYTNATSQRTFDGQITLGRNPLGGSYSALVLSQTVNGDLITWTGSRLWTNDLTYLPYWQFRGEPSDPAISNSVIWFSNGTGAGDDGDLMLKINGTSGIKTNTMVDYSSL